jgi:hypothetical protein
MEGRAAVSARRNFFVISSPPIRIVKVMAFHLA